jgi:hypothetical protein
MEMLRTLLLSLGAFTVLLIGFITRYGLATEASCRRREEDAR